MNDLLNAKLAVIGVAVLWFGYVYFGYPLLLGVFALTTRIRRVKRTDYQPKVSVLVAARNEEADIEWKVTETLAWNYPPELLEVLIGSDASEDRTDEIVGNMSNPRVRLIRMDRRGGKGRVLNRLVKCAEGELLFFTDANSHVGADSLRHIVSHFADPKVGCVTGHSYSGMEEGSPVAETGTAVYWGHELLIKSLEDKFGGVLACDGAIFCVRRSLYSDVSPELANDLELPLRIHHAGYQVCFEPRAVVMEKDTSSPSQEFARRRRICAQGALAMFRLRDTLRGKRALQFLSHKVLRWLTLVPMVMLLLSSAALLDRPLFAALFGLQVLFYVAAFIGWLQAARSGSANRLLATPLYIVVSSLGAFTGVCDAILGKRFDIWQSPTLTRGPADSSISNAHR
jgi:cellulose synthase/poly-beta-1,6-N-acetylglucosamine synthase-like glycosyltransferase